MALRRRCRRSATKSVTMRRGIVTTLSMRMQMRSVFALRCRHAPFRMSAFSVDCPGRATRSIARLPSQIGYFVIAVTAEQEWLREAAVVGGASRLTATVVEPPGGVEEFLCLQSPGAENDQSVRVLRGSRFFDGIKFLVNSEGNLRSMWRICGPCGGRTIKQTAKMQIR
jgi:hypothetical protein